jgi:hydrogenase expression/formation protein HypD
VFTPVDQHWRGLGVLSGSGLQLRPPYDALDAERHFGATMFGASMARSAAGNGSAPGEPANPCISGRVLQGLARPTDCPAYGGRCTPERPLGAPMVSAEGACAAYHRYRA